MSVSTEPDPRRRAVLRWALAGGAVLLAVAVVVVVVAVAGRGPRSSGPGPGASPSAGAVPSAGSAAPAGVASPGGSAAPAGSGGPVAYRVAGDLCGSVDFGPVSGLGGTPVRDPIGDHTEKSNYVSYTCDRTFAKDGTQLAANVTALVFTYGGAAAEQYADSRANAPATDVDTVSGLGTNAFGYRTGSGEVVTYQLWVVDGNLQLGVRLRVTSKTPPAAERLRTAATDLARATVPKLRA